MRTNVLACIPVPPELAIELDRTKAFPNVATVDNRTPLHLTIAVGCAGEFSIETLGALKKRLRKLRFPKFDLRFTGTEGFWSTALVVTTDLPQPLEKLRSDVVSVLESCLWDGFEVFDGEWFRPHVTVGRVWEKETPSELPIIMEEIPDAVWKVDSFALWTKEEGGDYVPAETFLHKSEAEWRGKEHVARFVRFVIRTLAQISLFFTCFLPLGTFLNDLLESVVKHGLTRPGAIDVAAFLSTLSATAAIWATLRRRMNVRLAHAVTALALACSVALFAAEIRELSICLATESEEFYCSWIYDALIWSSSIMAGLLFLYLWIPHSKKR